MPVTPPLKRLALLAIAASAASAASGAQAASPSFDCRKATTATEKAICASPALAALDHAVAHDFRAYLDEFVEDATQVAVRREQAGWLAERDRCGADATCLATRYRERAALLAGGSDALPMAGIYVAPRFGSVALFPRSDGRGYLAHVQTAQPERANWLCEFSATASATGPGVLRLAVEGGAGAFDLRIRSAHAVEIVDTPELDAATRESCGGNGTVAFTYERKPL